MKVILTIDFSPWSAYSGGAQRSTHNIAKAMCRRGHDVSVVFTKPPWENVSVPDDLPYDLHWAAFFDVKSRRRAPLRPLNAFSVAHVVEGLLDDGQYTVVHSNGEEGGLIHRLRTKHCFGFISTQRHPRYPDLLFKKKPVSVLDKARLFLREGKYLMQGSAARHADLCVPPSAFAADLVQRAYNIDPTRFRVVHNGVPEEFLHYEHHSDAGLEGPLVFFGRFEPTKGVDTLVEALGLLGDKAPRTLLIGRGPEQETLQQRINYLGLSDRVQLRPWMTHDELAQTLTTARLVVLPSRQENFSLAVLSAMAVGAPVISTHVGGTPEIIKHEENGLLVTPDEPAALAAAIRRICQDSALARSLGYAGREHIRTHLTWDIVAEAFEEIYCSLPAYEAQHKALSAP